MMDEKPFVSNSSKEDKTAPADKAKKIRQHIDWWHCWEKYRNERANALELDHGVVLVD